MLNNFTINMKKFNFKYLGNISKSTSIASDLNTQKHLASKCIVAYRNISSINTGGMKLQGSAEEERELLYVYYLSPSLLSTRKYHTP